MSSIQLYERRRKKMMKKALTPEEIFHMAQLQRLAILEAKTEGGQYYSLIPVFEAMQKQYLWSIEYLKSCSWIFIIWHYCYRSFRQKKFDRISAKFNHVTGEVFLNKAEIKLLKL